MAVVEQQLASWNDVNGWVNVLFDNQTLTVTGFHYLNANTPANAAVLSSGSTTVTIPPTPTAATLTKGFGSITMVTGVNRRGDTYFSFPAPVSVNYPG